MKLKKGINFTNFLLQVRTCQGEVCFYSQEGDQLNLKSLLSEFIFVAAVSNPSLLENGKIVCQDPTDYRVIADYVQEVPDEQ